MADNTNSCGKAVHLHQGRQAAIRLRAGDFHSSTNRRNLREIFAMILLVGQLLFILVGTNPYTDLMGESAGDPVASQSSRLNQLVSLGLFAGMFLFGISSGLHRLVMQPRCLLILIIIWFLFVSAIALHPDLSLKRLVLAVMTMISASVFLLLPANEKQFSYWLSICVLITLGFAYFGIIFKPHLAIHQIGDTLEPMLAGSWRGHFTHKNAAAGAMLLFVFFGIYCLRTGQKFIGLAIILTAIFFLLKTGGKTSSAMLPLIYGLSIMYERWRWTRIPIILGAVVLFNVLAVGAAISVPIRDFVETLGIDASFTNRSDVWRLAVKTILQHPWLGQGFLGFWQTSALVYSGGIETWAIAAFNGHNAYLDLILTVGIPGFLLSMIWIVYLPFKYSLQIFRYGNNSHLSRLYIRVWLYGLYSACMESIFFANGSAVWFFMMVSIFGLRLQVKAILVADNRRK